MTPAAKRRRLVDRTPAAAARILLDRFGDRAAQVASNRGDDASRYETRYFYERVLEEIRK